MPFSSGVFDHQIREHLTLWPFKKFLNIGAGSGKYGRFVRELVVIDGYLLDPEACGIEVQG